MNRNKVFAYAEAAGVMLDSAALDRLALLEQRLLQWNEHMNLTAITTENEISVKHFADSLSVFAAADMPDGARVIDVGCGAGFPGLPMLIARPRLNMVFLDSIGKKLSFINEVLDLCGLPGNTVHARAEDLAHDELYREQFDYAVSRAVAPMNILAEYALPLVKVGGTFIAMKGAQAETELGASAIEALGGETEKIVHHKLPNGDARNLAVIKKISQTPAKFPRKAKKITTKPL